VFTSTDAGQTLSDVGGGERRGAAVVAVAGEHDVPRAGTSHAQAHARATTLRREDRA